MEVKKSTETAENAKLEKAEVRKPRFKTVRLQIHDYRIHIMKILKNRGRLLDYTFAFKMFELSKYEFKLSKYETKLLKYETKLSKYEFKLSKYETKLSKYETKLSKYKAIMNDDIGKFE